jgi:calcium-dependent protein kinase
VIDRCYNKKCDIWSLGIILFVLLSGDAPFKGKNDDEVLQNIKKGEYNFLKNPWDMLSS